MSETTSPEAQFLSTISQTMSPGAYSSNNTPDITNITNNITAMSNFTPIDYSHYYDYENMQYPGDIKHVGVWEMGVKIIIYAVIILGAFVGNTLIIIVVMRNKKMQSTTNFFIVNLAVADILVTVCCTWVHLVNNLTEGWVLGAFFCKFNSFAQVTALVASIFSLVLIAFDRFFGIVHAMEAHIIERKASHSIAIIWLCAIAVAIPMLIVRETNSTTWADHVETWCSDDWPGSLVTDEDTGMVRKQFPSRKAYYVILTLVLYFAPMVLMSLLYSLIMWTVWFAQVPGERISNKDIRIQRRVKRKVVTMLVIILATFGVCWLPLQVLLLYAELKPQSAMLPEWYHLLEFSAYTLAFTNSALNPLIYAGFNDKFRKGFRALFGCYERKLYAAISRVDSMYNSSTTNMTKV